jgi:oligopeptide transport system permease protein
VIGRLLDLVHALLSGLPDFLLIILIQLVSIYLTRLTGSNVILVAHYGDNIPFTIPFLTIALIPGVLIYGTLRLAIEREMTQDYITTALTKGLSRRGEEAARCDPCNGSSLPCRRSCFCIRRW